MKQRRDQVRAQLEALGCDAMFFSTIVGGNDSCRLVNLRYLTGFSGSGGNLILGRDGDVLFTDSRYTEQAAKECPDLEVITYGMKTSGDGVPLTVFAVLEEAITRLGGKRLGVESQSMTLRSAKNWREKLPAIELVETAEVVEKLRVIKDTDEIEALRTACRYGDDGLTATLPQLKEGLTEFDVAVLLEHEMRRAGSEGVSFDTIVAFGEQAAEPHHFPTTRKLKRGDLIKFDFGGTHDGYHADMTRTVAFGEPTPAHREIYELVRASQLSGIEAVRAGVNTKDVDAAARDYLKERGRDFGHGTGHGVGLQVHENPGVSGAGDGTVLEPGMCITIEPGIYLPGDCGVRIEDSVAVTADGCDILTTFPKELLVV